MKFFIAACVLVLVCLQDASAQAPLNGTCEGTCTGISQNVNVSDYIGIWYLFQHTQMPKEDSRCNYFNASSVDGDKLVGTYHDLLNSSP
jgi:hypothetical protein